MKSPKEGEYLTCLENSKDQAGWSRVFKEARIEDEVKVQDTGKEYSSHKAFVGSERILTFTLNKLQSHWKILSEKLT